MCGRYSLTSPGEVLAEELSTAETPQLAPRYNIAPTQLAPVVRREEGERVWRPLRWGLVPAWARDATQAARQINARSETVRQKPSFRDAFARPDRRCLVPADGFYEWKEFGRRKQAFFVRRSDRHPMVFAGLWDRWAGEAASPLESFAILTCPPNARLADLHDRMPVILQREDFGPWLESDDLEAVSALLQPAPDPPGHALEYYAVGRAVHRADHEGPDCQEPAQPASSPTPSPPAPPRQGDLFSGD